MSKKFISSNEELSDMDTPRPSLADVPSMNDMIALYEKVLSELDSAISTQRKFASDDKSPVTN
jgi:hypothetical protein